MSRLSRRLYARGTDEYRALSLPADLPAAYASRRFAFARNSRSPTASSKHPLAGPRPPFRFRFLLVLQVGALATSVSDSLRQGSGSGLAPLGAHLRSPGHASHTRFRPCRGSFDAMSYPGACAPGYYLCAPPGPGRHTLQPSFATETIWPGTAVRRAPFEAPGGSCNTLAAQSAQLPGRRSRADLLIIP